MKRHLKRRMTEACEKGVRKRRMKRRMKKACEKGVRKRRMNKAYDKLGSPRGSLGVAWGAQGDFLRFVENWTPNSEQMCLFARACA